MGSSTRTGKFLPKESLDLKTCTFLTQYIKVPFRMGCPHLYIKPSLYVQGCSGVTNLQTEFNYLDLFMDGQGYVGWSALVYMCLGVFRGKKSKNRNELSELVQDLLNFGDFGSLQLWGRGQISGGIWGHRGCCQTHACTYMHTWTHIHIQHDNFFQMAVTIGFGEFPMMSYAHTNAYICMHTNAEVNPKHPQPHPTPRVDPQNSVRLEQIEIIQFCLQILNLWRIPPPWVGVWFGGCMVGWVNGSNHVRSLKI